MCIAMRNGTTVALINHETSAFLAGCLHGVRGGLQKSLCNTVSRMVVEELI